MENKYLGEEQIDISKTGFAGYTKEDWAMYFIGSYGQINGAHHKNWVLDQVARILKGTPVIVNIARWSDGSWEYRVTVNNTPSEEYLEWVKEMLCDGGDYDEGTAP